jgi:hypothetical protein
MYSGKGGGSFNRAIVSVYESRGVLATVEAYESGENVRREFMTVDPSGENVRRRVETADTKESRSSSGGKAF